MTIRPGIIACLAYGDAPRAIDFLCTAFGFTRHVVYPSETATEIVHAQLVLDGSMVMLSSSKSATTAGSIEMVTPAQAGGVTIALYVVLADPDAHYARAVAGNADIIAAPHDNDYGGRSYEARDLEGNAWSFGNYDPWAAPIPT